MDFQSLIANPLTFIFLGVIVFGVVLPVITRKRKSRGYKVVYAKTREERRHIREMKRKSYK